MLPSQARPILLILSMIVCASCHTFNSHAKVFVEEPLNVLSVQPDSIISFNCTLNLSVFECQDDGVLLEWHTPFVPLALHESGGQFNNVLGEFEWLSIQSSSQGCLLTKTLQFVAKEQYNKYAFQCAVGKVTHAIEKIWSKAAVLVVSPHPSPTTQIGTETTEISTVETTVEPTTTESVTVKPTLTPDPTTMTDSSCKAVSVMDISVLIAAIMFVVWIGL